MPADSGTIRIEYDISDIEEKTTDQKLDLLLRIAFANHQALQKHSLKLFGNGEQGLCDSVRVHDKAIKFIWGFFLAALIGLGGLFAQHVMK